MDTIINSILHSIKKNGFPDKRVTLPFKAIFQSCKSHDVSMSTVLKHLEEQDVLHEMKDDRIMFFAKGFKPKEKTTESQSGISEDMYKAAMEKLKEMDPGEVEKIKQTISQMSPEEQQEMLKKAKELFGKTN